jgi:hypothetical protein
MLVLQFRVRVWLAPRLRLFPVCPTDREGKAITVDPGATDPLVGTGFSIQHPITAHTNQSAAWLTFQRPQKVVGIVLGVPDDEMQPLQHLLTP